MPPRHAYWTIIFGNQPTAFRSATADELLPTLRQIQSKHPDAVMMWFAHGRLWKSPEDAREARFRKQQERRPRPQWGNRPPREDRGPAPARDARAPRPQPKDRWRNRPATGNRPPYTGKPRPDSGRPPTADGPAPPPASPKPRSGDGGKPRSGEGGQRPAPRGRDWRPGGEHKDPRDRFKVPRDVKRARFKAKLQRDRFDPKPRSGQSGPAPPKPRSGRSGPVPPKPRGAQSGPVPPKPRSGEGGRKKEDEE